MWRFFCYWPGLSLAAFQLGVASALFRGGGCLLWYSLLFTQEQLLPKRVALIMCLGVLWTGWLLPTNWKPIPLAAYIWRDRTSLPMLSKTTFTWAKQTQTLIEARLTPEIERRSAMLARGLLVGGSLASKQDAELARNAGVTHLVAVSGANLIFLLGVIRFPFRAIKRWWVRWIIESLLAIGLVVITGATSSMLRAGLMWMLASSAVYLGRKYSMGQGLVLAAWLFSIFQPWGMWLDVGFQLSYAACIGLIHAEKEAVNKGMIAQAGITQLTVGAWTLPISWWIFPRWTWNGFIGTLLLSPLVMCIQLLTILALLVPFTGLRLILDLFLQAIWSLMSWVQMIGTTFEQPVLRFWMIGITLIVLGMRLIHKILQTSERSMTNLLVTKEDLRRKASWKYLFLMPFLLDREPDLAFFLMTSMLRKSARQG